MLFKTHYRQKRPMPSSFKMVSYVRSCLFIDFFFDLDKLLLCLGFFSSILLYGCRLQGILLIIKILKRIIGMKLDSL